MLSYGGRFSRLQTISVIFFSFFLVQISFHGFEYLMRHKLLFSCANWITNCPAIRRVGFSVTKKPNKRLSKLCRSNFVILLPPAIASLPTSLPPSFRWELGTLSLGESLHGFHRQACRLVPLMGSADQGRTLTEMCPEGRCPHKFPLDYCFFKILT